ncbi:MAG TPA: UDP-N-acetylglucosamine 1-carboxyvinyltransferase [Aggregatilineales bacterium]|nr:UDP-N-acetylglucosamine 1-carboxyvinyltransferase [Aggregatilineales bacterium]
MRIHVEGRQALNGVYQPDGNPNSAVALLAASLLTDQPVTLANLPRTTNIETMIDVARYLGAEAAWNADGTLTLSAPQIARRSLAPAETQGLVSAILYMAPVLTRRGYVRLEVDYPLNRIRTHLDALRDLGQDVLIVDGAIEVRSARWTYRDIMLSQASVTATEIALMLACVLGRETIIRNAASEPHVQELAVALELMGAQIEGIGSNVLHVFAHDEPLLHGAQIRVGVDHIEAASVAAIAALTGGRLEVAGTKAADMHLIARVFGSLGLTLDVDSDRMFVPRHGQLTASNREEDVDSSIKSATWPGFPSDLVAIATVVATQTRGTSLIHEPLFDNRLLFVDKLNSMGAQIVLCDPHRAIVVGPSPLYPIYMDTPDVRVGLALLGAAMIADGVSVIDNAQAITRSFGDIFSKLTALGARITIDS